MNNLTSIGNFSMVSNRNFPAMEDGEVILGYRRRYSMIADDIGPETEEDSEKERQSKRLKKMKEKLPENNILISNGEGNVWIDVGTENPLSIKDLLSRVVSIEERLLELEYAPNGPRFLEAQSRFQSSLQK